MTVGEKIRLRRKELGLTQREVAGDAVTRNLICRIERGDCLPSLDSLAAIAKALSVPVAYLVSEEDDFTAFAVGAALPDLREAYAAGRFADVMTLIGKLPPDGIADEVACIASAAALGLAERSMREGNLKKIPEYVEAAKEYAKKTVLPTDWILARAELCRAVAKSPESPRWEVRREEYLSSAEKAIGYNDYLYLTDENGIPCDRDSIKLHREARDMIANRRYREALTTLLALEEKKSSGELPPYFLYRIYSDTETCYRELGDFEMAYRYSSKRVSLLREFRE